MDKNINTSIETYKEGSYEKFKGYERTRFLFTHILPRLEKAESVLDIGCAKGELIYAMKERFPEKILCLPPKEAQRFYLPRE